MTRPEHWNSRFRVIFYPPSEGEKVEGIVFDERLKEEIKNRVGFDPLGYVVTDVDDDEEDSK